MSDALILALIIVGLIVLDVSAYFYGYDSREGLRPHDFDHS